MKKALFIIVLVLVMAATVAPARSVEWNYVFVTFVGSNSDYGEQTFRLFLEYEGSSGTHLNIKGTLLAFEQGWDNPPAILTGSADIEPDGTVDSFNVTGSTSNFYYSYTYDFDFIIHSGNAKVTMTFTQPVAFGGTTTTDYVFEGTWDLRSCP